MSTCERCGASTGPMARVCRACGKVIVHAPVVAEVEVDLDKTVDRSVLAHLAAPPATPEPAEPPAPAVAAQSAALHTEPIPVPAATTSNASASPSMAPPAQSSPPPLPPTSPEVRTPPATGPSGYPSPAAPFWARVRASWDIAPGAPAPPTQLWAVIGMLGLIGIGSVGWSIYWASQALSLFSLGRFAVAVGVFVLGVLAIPLSFGLGCIYLARRLQASDRVARVLTVVLCLSAAAAFILSGARDLTLVLVALVCIGVAVMLLADPATKNHFTGPHAVYGNEPPPVVASRVLIVIVGCCIFLVGVMLLPLSEIDGALVVYGLLDIGIATLVFWLSRRLSRGDPAARVFVTGLALLYAVLSLVVGHGEPGVILPVGLALGTVGLLWLPRSSRVYFASLPRPSQPAVAAAERAIEGLISSLTAAGSPAPGPPTFAAPEAPPLSPLAAAEQSVATPDDADQSGAAPSQPHGDHPATEPHEAALQAPVTSPITPPVAPTVGPYPDPSPAPFPSPAPLPASAGLSPRQPFSSPYQGPPIPFQPTLIPPLSVRSGGPRTFPVVVTLVATIALALDFLLPPAFKLYDTQSKPMWTDSFVHLDYLGWKVGGQFHHYPAFVVWTSIAIVLVVASGVAALLATATRSRRWLKILVATSAGTGLTGLLAATVGHPNAGMGIGSWAALAFAALVVIGAAGALLPEGPQGEAPSRVLAGIASIGVVGLLIGAVPALHTNSASAGTSAYAGSYNAGTVSPPYTGYTPSYDTTTTVTPVAADQLVNQYNYTETEAGGYTFAGTLSLGTPEPFQQGITEEGLTAGSACSITPRTDAVIPGLLTVQSTTTNFDTYAGVDLSWSSSVISGIEAGFTGSPSCLGDSGSSQSLGMETTDQVSDGQGASLGIFIVIPNYYSPDQPNGDQSLLSGVDLNLGEEIDSSKGMDIQPASLTGPGASSSNGYAIPLDPSAQPSSTPAAGQPFHIIQDGTGVYDSPTNGSQVATLNNGTTVSVLCTTQGDSVQNDTLWDKIASPAGYVSDNWVSTNAGAGLPAC